MKKFLVVVFISVIVFFGCGCQKIAEEKTRGSSMFVCVETELTWKIVYHQTTKVMYAVSQGMYNMGTFTMLLNADGTPMLYEGN